MIKLANDEVPNIGSIVKVCITCIVNVDELYIHIPEISARYDPSSLKELKNELNAPETVKLYKPVVGMPSDLQHDLVLVKLQGLFYRAKVIDFDEEQNLYIVYFLDYGYTESIHQKAIFQWYPRWNTVPGNLRFICSKFSHISHLLLSCNIIHLAVALAYRCCLENVGRIERKDVEATKALRNLILNTGDISAKIM